MRKRKRPDTTQRVLKYRVYAKRLPETLWQTAKAMQALWNQLVTERNELSARAVEEGHDVWAEFDGIVKYLLVASGLNWECGPAVVDRFRSACQSAAKNLRDWPHEHRGLRRIMTPHRYTGGGISTHRLFSDRAERIRLTSPPAAAYASERRRARYLRRRGFRFGLGGKPIYAEVVLHREIPEIAIVKQVAWCGERVGPRWDWYLTITIEEDPVEREATGRACGVDVGWRLTADREIRGAMIADSDGREIEFTLPLLLDNAHSRRYKAMHIDGWLDLEEWDRQLSGADRGTPEHRRIASIRHELYRRLVRTRTKIYERLAAWLASNYDHMVIEGDLAIKRMAENPEKNAALDAADRYRQIVAPATLLQTIRNAARFRGAEVVNGETAYSTLTCWICGGVLSGQDGSLWLRCPRGHQWDQDVNAARNLLSQSPPLGVQNGDMRKPWRPVPEDLVKFVTVR